MIHPLNPRQDVPAEDIAELAASIEVNGLLQNLCGYLEPRARNPGIVAGGRRLRALQLLVKQGKWTDDVPVLTTRDRDQAIEWAGAENEAREPLHPAEEIRHYRDLHAAGHSYPQIARAYAVTEGHVARRMKLAHLPDPVIAALKDHEITLDVAQAFTISTDEAAILSVLDRTRARDIRPQAVREALTPGAVTADERRAIYVGVQTYEDAGGAITPDLFTGATVLHDTDLLERLFRDKLEAERAMIATEEGWQDVHAVQDTYIPYGTTDKLTAICPEPVELPEADGAELQRLEELPGSEFTDEIRSRIRELRARKRGDYSDDQRTEAQIWIYVNRQGVLCRDEAYTTKARAQKDASTKGAAPEPKGLSQVLVEDLRAVRTLALQIALETQPDLILGLAAYQIDRQMRAWHRPAEVTLGAPRNIPSVEEAVTAPDWATEIEVEGGQEPDAQGFQDFLAESRTIPILSRAIARATSAQGTDFTRALMQTSGADIRAVWRPTLANFFGRCPVSYLDAVQEMIFADGAPDIFAPWTGLKKKEKAALLSTLFDTTPETIKAYGLSDDLVARLNTWIPEEIA